LCLQCGTKLPDRSIKYCKRYLNCRKGSYGAY
jgi:hypothetical protein